ETQPVFRQVLDRCNDILKSDLEISLIDVPCPEDKSRCPIDDALYAQPALFALQCALFELWQSWGIAPSAVMGHGAGEYAAACAAGVFSLEDGLKLVAARGRLMQALPQDGAPAAVSADKAQVEKRVADFEKIARQVSYAAPQMRIVSNVTGGFVEKEIATAGYWVRQVRQPPRFSDGVKTFEQKGYAVFVELGCDPVLLQMARARFSSKKALWLAGLRQGRSDWSQLLSSLGELYVRGLSVDWQGFDRAYPRRKVELPTYPFQRRRYWIDKAKSPGDGNAVPSDSATSTIVSLLNKGDIEQLTQLVTKKEYLSENEKKLLPKILKTLVRQQARDQTTISIKDWLYEVQWPSRPRDEQRAGQGAGHDHESGMWLIFADHGGVGQGLAALLEAQGHHCIMAYPGEGYHKGKNDTRIVNPARASDFERLLQEIKAQGVLPLLKVVHLWSLDAPDCEALSDSGLDKAQLLGCASVLHTVQALAKYDDLPRLWLVTRGAVAAAENRGTLAVVQSPLWGLGKVICLEHPDLWGGLVDLSVEAPAEEVARLAAEFQDPQGEDQIAFRAGERHVSRLVRSRPAPAREVVLQADGTYLITGGLGALGLKTAKWLVEQGGRHLVLLGRRGASGKAQEVIAQLEQAGAGIRVEKADVSNPVQMARVFEKIATSGFALRGVIHAAGVMDDAILLRQSWPRFKQVMSPKVTGTWNLHALTRDLALDFFVCFSSVASLLGSPGQGNYASANAFMDALIHYRRRLGLPGLSINWGPWESIGMASRMDKRDLIRLATQGVKAITQVQGIASMEYLLGQMTVQAGVLCIDWLKFMNRFSS
ncbi:MAG TPA: SDR family NAD(P)-dependent oxidoreductase, partial [Anaerolineales bacterium]